MSDVSDPLVTGAARPPQTDRYVCPGGGIDDLQKRYSRLNLVASRPHYGLVTLIDHMGSSLDRLEVDQRGRTFPPRAPRRLAATPNRNVSCLHTSIVPEELYIRLARDGPVEAH